MSSDIKYVRIVQLIEGTNSENEAFSEFIETSYRPCVVNNIMAIDIITREKYYRIDTKRRRKIVDILSLENQGFYAAEVLTPQFPGPSEELTKLRRQAEETATWYANMERQRQNPQVIDFQKVRRRGARRKI